MKRQVTRQRSEKEVVDADLGAAYLKDSDGMIEVVVLHSGGGINAGQRGGRFHHVLIGVTTVVHVMT